MGSVLRLSTQPHRIGKVNSHFLLNCWNILITFFREKNSSYLAQWPSMVHYNGGNRRSLMAIMVIYNLQKPLMDMMAIS